MFQENPCCFHQHFLYVIVAVYTSLLIVLARATFQCYWHSILDSQVREEFHKLWVLPNCFFYFFSPCILILVLLLPYCECYRIQRVYVILAIFYLTLLLHIWCMHWLNLLLSRFSRELAVLSWRLQSLLLWFETQTQSFC